MRVLGRENKMDVNKWKSNDPSILPSPAETRLFPLSIQQWAKPDWTRLNETGWAVDFFSRLLAVHSLSGIVSIAPPVQHLIMHELNVNSNWLNCGTGKLRPPQHGNYQWKTQKRHCHGALLCGATTAVSQRFLWRKRMNSHFRMIRTYREFSALPYDTLNK